MAHPSTYLLFYLNRVHGFIFKASEQLSLEAYRYGGGEKERVTEPRRKDRGRSEKAGKMGERFREAYGFGMVLGRQCMA